MNLICKLFGHKWRDTSYWEFKRENGKKLKRNIIQQTCQRCDKEEVCIICEWQPDEYY